MKKRSKVLALFMVGVLIAGLPAGMSLAQKKVKFFSYSDTRYNATIANGNGVSSVFSVFDFDKQAKQSQKAGVLIKFKESVNMETISSIVCQYNYEVIGKSEGREFCLYDVTLNDLNSKYSSLLEYCEKPVTRKLSNIPNDKNYNYQKNMQTLDMPNAWDITTGSSDVKIGVIDTGILRNHEDFTGVNILPGKDVISGGICATDPYGHGTMVSGIIAAKTNNSIGIAGIVWNATLLPVQVSYGQSITSAGIVKAIKYAADSGCKVINMSFGGAEYSMAELDAVSYALKKGCILVAASGNDRMEIYEYPASFSGVISVGACDSKGILASFSTYNDRMDLVAMGEDVLSINNEGGYSYASGTSFASPQVAAVVALAAALKPNLITEDVQAALPSSCENKEHLTPYNKFYGYGILNAKKFLEYFRDNEISNIREISSNADIKAIDVSDPEASYYSLPIQLKKKSDTRYTLNTTADTLYVAAQPVDYRTSITGTGKKVLKKGLNTFYLKAKAEDGTTKSYTLEVNKTQYSTGKFITVSPLKFNNTSGKKMTIKFKWSTQKRASIKLKVTQNNNVVKTLFNKGTYYSGNKKILWNGKNSKGRYLLKGKYYLELTVNTHKIKKAFSIK